jgi:pyrroloquinoline quinone biosynthesis protein B
LPQWNCACPNCRDARLGRIPTFTQSCVAIGDDQGGWFLINASPDLAAQINSFSDLRSHSSAGSLRSAPISGVLLTNADLDHVIGLLSLREGGRVRVYATNAVRDSLTNGFNVSAILNAFCGVDWTEPVIKDFSPLIGIDGKSGSIEYRAIALPGGPPLYDKNGNSTGPHSVAYSFRDRKTGGRLLVAPDVGAWNDTLTEVMRTADAILFDGTFWSGDELSRVKANARTAAEMGHLTIRDDSLARLQKLPARHKIYIHINNTNPVLSSDSSERAAVESAGVAIGYDGLEFEV